MKISSFDISKKVFIVAEISANHISNLDITKKSILKAKEAGADAVKLQTFSAESLALNVKRDSFKLKNTIWKGRYLYDLYKEIAMPMEFISPLVEYAKEIGILLFSTPFSIKDFNILKEFNLPCYKIASFEINHLPLLKVVAKEHKPIIISCGVASIEEISDAIECCYDEGNRDIILLKCVSDYPAKVEDMNLNTIHDMKRRFGTLVGLSDHSIGNTAPVVATTLGAVMIEKHFKLDDSIDSSDSSFSLNFDDFKSMVDAVRKASSCAGNVVYSSSNEFYKRGMYASRDISIGELFCCDNIAIVRPAEGLSPKYYHKLIGKKSQRYISSGEPIFDTDL